MRSRSRISALIGAALVLFSMSFSKANGSTINWQQLTPPASPSSRYLAAMAYDAPSSQMVLFGGFAGSWLGDTWTWNGSTWSHVTPGTSPAQRSGAVMVMDESTGHPLLFGGFSGGPALNDTWTWSGSTWTHLTPASSPPARQYAAMAYDAAHGRAVMFGGYSGSYYGDTWTWDGSNWTQMTPASSPPARNVHGMAYDAATGQVVLFGGYDGHTFFNDTWTWDGSTWTQQHPASSPSGRDMLNMVGDPSSGHVVLFGGYNSSSFLNDTWMWDGGNWVQQFPAASPSPRGACGLAFDAAAGRLLLFGGRTGPGSSVNDTWEECTAPSITGEPASRSIESGNTVALSVTALGTDPLTYQWYQGSSGDTSTPVGTDSNSYTTPALTSTTNYWVRVTNSCGLVDSATAVITVGTVSGVSITGINPSSGKAGAKVTIAGTGFSKSAKLDAVYFGTMKAKVSKATATSLKVKVPKLAKGAVNVTVVVGGQTSNAQPFTVK